MLGTREPDKYGSLTLNEIKQLAENEAAKLNAEITFMQTNIEGEMVSIIQQAESAYDGIVINPAAYTHTSIALRDALLASKVPAVEIHISNIYKREEFRHKSLTAPACIGQISGFGADSYILGLYAVCRFLKRA